MPGARYSLGSFPEGAVSPFGAHADGETEGVALIFVSLFPPTAVLFLRPVSCSFLSEITKLSLRRKRGGGTEKSFDLPWRGETDQIKISSLSSRKRKGARANKKPPFSTEKEGSPLKQKAPFLNAKGGELKQKTAPPRGRTEEDLFAKIQLLPGRAVSALLGLNSMWNQTSGAIKWVDRSSSVHPISFAPLR